ncbi:MAG TPA: hypothetical protein VGF23_18595, partial [Gaiellaceae bacterium]
MLVKKVLRCDCSFEARAADEDGLVSEVQRHAREALLPGASAAAGALAVVVVAFALLAAQAAGARGTPASVHVSLQPSLVTLGSRATVRVDGWHGARLQVALAGATNRNGRPLGWRDARRHGRTWLADLPHPTLRGIYQYSSATTQATASPAHRTGSCACSAPTQTTSHDSQPPRTPSAGGSTPGP